MKNYMIYLERKDKHRMYRYFRFERQVANFHKALEAAEAKVKELKLQININYEVIKIEKI